MSNFKTVISLTALASLALAPGCKQQANPGVETRAPAAARPAAPEAGRKAAARGVETAVAAADQDQPTDQVLKSFDPKTFIPIARAISIAQAKLPGALPVEVDLELDWRKNVTRPVFIVEFFVKKGAPGTGVVVDARDGQVLGLDTTEPGEDD